MDLNHLLSERPKLEQELRRLDLQAEIAERERIKRAARRLEIAKRLGWIAAIEAMVSTLPQIVSPEAAFKQIENAVPTDKDKETRRPYGQSIETIRKILRESPNKKFAVRGIMQTALSNEGVRIKEATIRSALRRMRDEGDVRQIGNAFIWAKTELEFNNAEERNETSSTEEEATESPQSPLNS